MVMFPEPKLRYHVKYLHYIAVLLTHDCRERFSPVLPNSQVTTFENEIFAWEPIVPKVSKAAG